jgi:hypothetical protein
MSLEIAYKKPIGELPLHKPTKAEDMEEYLFNVESSPLKKNNVDKPIFILRYE